MFDVENHRNQSTKIRTGVQSIEHQVCSPIAGREHADQFGAAHGVAGGWLETQAICQKSASRKQRAVADCLCVRAAALASQAGATQQAVSMDCARCWTSVSCFFCSFINMHTKKGVNSTVSIENHRNEQGNAPPSVQSVAASSHATKPN